MTFNSNAFHYMEGVSYQFLVIGTTPYESYEQIVTVNVYGYNFIPTVNIG